MYLFYFLIIFPTVDFLTQSCLLIALWLIPASCRCTGLSLVFLESVQTGYCSLSDRTCEQVLFYTNKLL